MSEEPRPGTNGDPPETTEDEPRAGWVRRHPFLAALLIFLSLPFIFEALLRLGLFRVLVPFDLVAQFLSQPIVLSTEAHHALAPNQTFFRETAGIDVYEPVENRINSLGIRGPEVGPKQAYRVLVVGDSFVQAEQIPFADTFGELLNERFRGRIEFVSHGVASWSPTTEFSWIYHYGLGLEPDEVVLVVFANDFFRVNPELPSDIVYRSRARYEDRIPVSYEVEEGPANKVPWLMEHLLLARTALWYGGKWYHQDLEHTCHAGETRLLSADPATWPPGLTRSVDKTLAVIGDLDEFLKQRGIRLTVTLAPLQFSWGNEWLLAKQSHVFGYPADLILDQSGLERRLRGYLAERGIAYLDLKAGFDEAKAEDYDRLLFLEGDGHWNQNGHRVVAEVLGRYYEGREESASAGQRSPSHP